MPPGPWSFFRHMPLKSSSALLKPKEWAYTAFQVAKILLIAHTIEFYLGGITGVSGISMMPTIPSFDDKNVYVLYSRLHRRGRKIKVGDIVTFAHPMFPTQRACKRVVGMPGDFVSVITPGRRNEDLETLDVNEKWASVKDQVVRVPEGHCWVAGDNLEWSRDSRYYGPLPLGLVKSKALAIVYPFKEAKWLGSEGLNDMKTEEKRS